MPSRLDFKGFQFVWDVVNSQRMTTPDFECCAPFLKALGDKTRWRIVQELLSDAITVSELAERLKVSQYNISKHLRILRETGIVEAVRRGKHVHCRIVPTFQRRVANNKNQLDLGCCVFRFEKRPR
jgi:DNA-binding transcriptional ArsR family regulator